MKKSKYRLVILICGILCLAFMDLDVLQTETEDVQPIVFNSTAPFYETALDKKINHHLSQSAMKLQVQDLQNQPIAYSTLQQPSVSFGRDESIDDSGLSEGEKQILINQLQEYPYHQDIAYDVILAEQKAEEEAQKAFIADLKEKARKDGFELVIKGDMVVDVKKISR